MTLCARYVSVFCVCLMVVRRRVADTGAPVTPWLLFANHKHISRLSLDGKHREVLSRGHKAVHVLDYDLATQKIYFADDNVDKIQRINTDGSVQETVEHHHSFNVADIAVDWVARKMYWTMTTLRGMFVAELNGTHVKVLVRSQSPKPKSIAVHPRKGYVFWTDWSLTPFIGRVGMDGDGFSKIVSDGIGRPSGVTVDYVKDHVWWTDIKLDRIEYANLDGTNRHVFLTSVTYAYAVEVFRDSVYWSDWQRYTIEKVDMANVGNRTVLIKTKELPSDLHIYHPERQPKMPNPCSSDNGRCSHLCLIKAGGQGHRCACPEYFILGDDGKTCTANCSHSQFECGRSDHKCIPLVLRCDGSRDCKGGEDEANCGAKVCFPGAFKCHDGGCVPAMQLCDGTPNCNDGTDEHLQMCTDHVCLPFQFRCRSGQCILPSWECDGSPDCKDRSDEFPLNAHCTNGTQCSESQFTCENNQKCVPKSYFCDGTKDCSDGSDEPTTICMSQRRPCEEGSVRCNGSYDCVPLTGLCDGQKDCSNGWDEVKINCPRCEPSTHFTCSSGACIPRAWQCDFHQDCSDDSDEKLSVCETQYRKCSQVEFTCKNGRCVHLSFVCDADDDCRDNSDEINCRNTTCGMGKFQCRSGQCISKLDECNGWKDCDDFSDEHDNCPTQFPNGRLCPVSQFQCSNKVCIKKAWECDGTDDCGDGSDEAVKLCRPRSCDQKTHFLCENFACIPRWERCNGLDNCGDASDENTTLCVTSPPVCGPDEFKCRNRRCVAAQMLCDHVDNCGDQSDERGCHSTGEGGCHLRNGGCVGNCTTLPGKKEGYLCSCPPGMTTPTSDPKSCVDVDECISWGNFCPQKCVNTRGSFKCECHPGFTDVRRTGTVCKPTEMAPKDLESYHLATASTIIQYFPREELYRPFVMNQAEIRATDYDPINRLIYWVDASTTQLKRAQIPVDEANVDVMSVAQDLGLSHLQDPAGVAFDWLAGNVYWTETAKSAILVARHDGNYKKTLLTTDKPTAIAVDPELALMFWIDEVETRHEIMRTDMDGAHRRTVISTELISPNDLAIDLHMGHRLYWSDPKKDVIESADIDGSDRVIVIKNGMARTISLDVFAGDLFWLTSGTSQSLFKQDKFGRGLNQSVLGQLNHAASVKIFYPHRYYSQIVNHCARMSCIGLCLLSPGGATCACPDGAARISAAKCNLNSLTFVNRSTPRLCRCEHGGSCTRSADQFICMCSDGYHGDQCELHPKQMTQSTASPSRSLVVPVVISIVVIILALMIVSMIVFWIVHLKKKRSEVGTGLRTQQGTSWNETPHIDLPNTTEFTNPLYSSMDRLEFSSEENTVI